MSRFRPCVCLLSLLLAMLCPTAGGATEVLRVLTWPGYADPDVISAFEQRTGARVELTLIDSDQTLWQKISHADGADFDVFAANTAELQRYIDRALVLPIAPGAIPNRARQLPRFRDPAAVPGTLRDGQLFAVPYTYAEMGLIYDRRQFSTPPDSIDALWDPRLRGKVLAYDGGSHNFSIAALALGRDSPFRLGEADWAQAVDKLIALRRNVLTFYTAPEESVELFMREGAALLFANYGSQQLQLLRAAGADVGYVIPREGALAWLDCWAITRGTRNKTLAEAWIDFLLEPKPGEILVSRQGLANTTSQPPYQKAGDRLLWLEPVENVDRRSMLWERILSGDRATRVLAP